MGEKINNSFSHSKSACDAPGARYLNAAAPRGRLDTTWPTRHHVTTLPPHKSPPPFHDAPLHYRSRGQVSSDFRSPFALSG